MDHTTPKTTITVSNNITEDNTTNKNNLRDTSSEMIIGITMAALVALAFCIFNVIIIKRKKKNNTNKGKNENISTYHDINI